MRKLIYVFVLILIVGQTYAQEGTNDSGFVSKRGLEILPKAGDIALGIDAAPFLNYVGNMFNNSVGNTMKFNFMNATNTIFGKYYLDDHSAVRAFYRFANTSNLDREYVLYDQDIPDPEVVVADTQLAKNSFFAIGLGYEMHRGQGRLHGVYGGQFTFYRANGTTNYSYGNDLTATNSNPTTHDYGSNVTTDGRITEVVNGTSVAYGLEGFIGVEYFFAPKICLGGEFNWGFNYMKQKDGSEIEQSWDFVNNTMKTTTTKIAGDKASGFDTGNLGGSIYLLFHF